MGTRPRAPCSSPMNWVTRACTLALRVALGPISTRRDRPRRHLSDCSGSRTMARANGASSRRMSSPANFFCRAGRARVLHADQGLGAREIANRTRLPLALVRQQLFDALLLPPAEATAEMAAPAYVPRPDPSQDRAADHRGSPFQLQAGLARVKKTRTLVKRVASLIAEGIDPAAILILTFSNRAAASCPSVWPARYLRLRPALGRHLSRLRARSRPPPPQQVRAFGKSNLVRSQRRDRTPGRDPADDLPLEHYRNLWDPAMVLRDVVAAISRPRTRWPIRCAIVRSPTRCMMRRGRRR